MEGVGEGLVAIVQGLEHAGVTLTVCTSSRHNSGSRPSGPRILINGVNNRSDMPAADQRQNTMPAVTAPPGMTASQPAVQRTSVETSTGPDFSRMATASQICDGRYASSYKLAHCMMSPTSPPEAVTEFPPQRKEPCRNKGNFEIGGQSSGQWSGHGTGHNVSAHGSGPVRVSTSRFRHYGGTQTWGDKGSNHRYSKSNHRETEAFAHSLRKYPSMAPFRTASTDLIEKLIRYTQAKNYQEMSRSTKSMRSLRNQKSSEMYDTNRVSTHQQTYTRKQDDNFRHNSHVQVGYRGRTRNFKLYSPVSDSRNLRESRYRETTVTSSYDYLKAGNPPYGRSNRSDGSPSPTRSRSPEKCPSPERSCNPGRIRSPDGYRSPDGSRLIRAERFSRMGRPLRFERSVRDLSLSEMSKYIRSTIRQICNERPVVVQVCPKLKDRYNQHRKVCPKKNERSSDVMEFEEEECPEDQASGSVLSRFLQSFIGRPVPLTEQAGCQCTRTDCYCTKATQCVNNPTASTNTATCSCTNANTGCCRGMPCLCASKSQDLAYYNKRIDEEVSEWLKDVHSIENTESKTKRETIVKKLRETLKNLPDDKNFEENATNEIQDFVNDFPLWNPGKDENDEKLFKNQLADKLAEKIIRIPRKPDRFRDIVKKWVVNMDFEEDGEEVDMEAIIDNFVNRLKSLAVNRPACDIKYKNLLRKDIMELLVELPVKFDGDMLMLKKMANSLATDIVSIPRNVNLGETSDPASEFEENIADWICEHGLCEELKRNPKLIESLAKKLNKLKSQGIFNEDVIEKMKEEVQQFVDDVGLAFETIDELIEELMTQLSSTIQMKEMERLDLEELNEEISDWLHSLPGASDLHPRKFEKITKELVKIVQESIEQENENLANDIVDYLVHTDLSIDSVDLGIYVEELMEHLSILPSDRYYREQGKRLMLKDIYDIIECSPIPEEMKEEMKRRARQIVENNLRMSSFNLRHAPDEVKEALLRDMDDFVSDVDIPKKSQLKLKSLLSTSVQSNFDKQQSRNRIDLKQSIASDIRNAVKELPIDTVKKKNLMQQVKGTLSKNMNKPLPRNVKNNINDEICDVVERCPICEDRNILGCIKKMLSEVASKHLTINLPKCVCDIQNEVEEDVSIVIDRSAIDIGKKRELKENTQDILTENEDRRLTDEVIRNIKDDIISVVSDLSMPRDKKDVLNKAVGETVSKDFNEADKAFRHDLSKIRNKILDDITNIIEKAPIQRNAKSHFKDKLNAVLAKNLDSSLSHEEKHMILDDASDIVKDDMPEDKKRSLTNKLAKKFDTHQRKEKTEGLTEIINRLSIDSNAKDDMKRKIKAMLLKTLYHLLSDDVQQQINEDVLNAIDEMDIPEYDKNNLKSNISHVMAKELDKLIVHDKEVPEIKAAIEKLIANEIKNSTISKDRQELLVKKLKDVLTENLVRPITGEVRETIKERLGDIVDDLITNEGKAETIKTRLLNIVNKDLDRSAQNRPSIESNESLRQKQQPMNFKELENETQDNILRDIEQAVDEAPIAKEKKIELKKKLKNIAINNFKRPLDDVAEGLKDDINVILDEINFSKDKKNKLKSELTATVDRNMNDLQGATRTHKTKVKDSIFQGIEKIIEESAVPEKEKMELKRKLKNMAAETLKKPFSENVQDGVKNGIADLIDDLHISKSEKKKLKNALTNMVDILRKMPIQVDHCKELEDEPLNDSFQEMERVIERAPIPGEKKIELKKKLKKLTTKDFNEIPLEDFAEVLKDGLIKIIDELNLPKDKKNKLKSALTNKIDENMDILLSEPYEMTVQFDNLKELENKVQRNILHGIDKIIEDSAILEEEQNIELKRKLKKMAAENLKKHFSEAVRDATINGIAEIIDDMPIPEIEKNKLERALTNMVAENVNNLRGIYRDQVDNSKELEDTTLDNILKEMERTIEEAPMPREKKIELKKKFKNLAIKNFKRPLEDVAEGLQEDINKIFDELNFSKDKENKLKCELIAAVDRNMNDLQGATAVDKTKVKESIFRGIEKVIEKLAVPEEKKVELKRKLKKMAAENLKKPLSESMQDAISNGIAEIVDDLPIPKAEKNKLKRTLPNMVAENVNNLRGISRDQVDNSKELEDTTVDNILREMERTIKEAPMPRKKNIDLKKKFMNGAIKNFKRPLENVAEGLKEDINKIVDDPNLPKERKNTLKSKLTTAVDRNMNDLQGATRVDKTDVKDSIFQGIENIIRESAVPEKQKMEMKRIIKKVAAENLKKPFSENVEHEIKNSIADLIDDLPIPKSEKNKLKNALTNMVDENFPQKMPIQVNHLRDLEDKLLHNIFLDMERAIKEAPIYREKKNELKKKLRDLATKDFNNKSLDEFAKELKVSMIEIIDELNLQKDKKNKLESALINMINENMNILGSEPCERPSQVDNLEELGKTLRNILQGFEKIIEEAPMPLENKMELKKKLKDIATKNFKKPLSYKVSEALKDDVFEIIEELNLPQNKKSQLNNGLTAVVDENMSNLKNELKFTKPSRYREKRTKTQHIIDESNLKESMKDEIKKSILQSEITDSKKSKLKFELLRMVSGMLSEFDKAVHERLKYIFDKYGIKPNYQKQLAEEYNKLLEITLKGGDIEVARRKLIAKLMRDLNLSEEVASVLADELIEKSREMAQKEGVEDFLKARENILKEHTGDDQVVPEHEVKITESKEAFAKATNIGVDQSTISKLENTEVLQDCKKIVDESSIPADKKNELKLLLKKELAKTFGEEVMDDYDDEEEVTLKEDPTAEEYKEILTETIKTWMASLPMDWDPEVATDVAEDLASDIIDRQKYLKAHPEAILADNDEIENLKYQVFRRMNNIVDPKDMPLIMERTEDLYRMIMDIKPPTGVPKLRQTCSRG